MAITHKVLIAGNSLSFRGGFFGFSSVVLIRADGCDPVLFDTGHHCMRLLLLDALKQEGLEPADIHTIFLSHLHFDHANNIDMFPNATVWVSATEVAYARAPSAGDVFCSVGMNEYLARHAPRLIRDAEGELLPGLHYRHAPGHTPGSYVLHYRDAAGQRVVVAGDACKTYRELAAAHAANEFDREHRASQTLRWIADNADVVVPGHFPELRRTEAGWIWDDLQHLDLIVR